MNITCTCSARFSTRVEHENCCELWLLDDFWNGALTWDPDRELLVHNVTDTDTDDDDDMALTTSMFIERMLQNNPDDSDASWVQDDDGHWIKSGVRTAPQPVQTRLPSSYDTTQYDTAWDWGAYTKDRHRSTVMPFPDGEMTIQTCSLYEDNNRSADELPDFGLYVDSGWRPEWLAIMLPWRDFGLPEVGFDFVAYAIEEAYNWAKGGSKVEVGCIGAHGRTGSVLACMVLLNQPDFNANQAIAYVRTAYCHHAIETREQEWFVARFHAHLHNTPIPEMPKYQPPKATVIKGSGVVNSRPKAPKSHVVGSVPDPNKPGRKKRNRRSKRGGKRNRVHTGGRR